MIMKNKNNYIINARVTIFKSIMFFSFFIIIIFLININVINRKQYLIKLDEKINKVYSEISYPRGRIYDRNYNLLVDNVFIPIIYYIKPNKLDYTHEIAVAKKLSLYLDIDYSKINSRIFNIYYLVNHDCNDLITNEEWDLYNRKKLTYNDIYNYKIERLGDFYFDNSNEEEKKLAYIFYLMNNGYSYEKKIIKKENLSDIEIAAIIDNINELPGIGIDYIYEREYLYNDTLRSILGTVSKITNEDKDYYLSQGYNMSDYVGTSYIEKQYDNYLRGVKGTYKIKNNQIIPNSYGERGKDIVLTIDINLQQEIDKILDDELMKIKKEPATSLFNSIYVVIKDPNNGEILSISGRAIRKEGDKYVTYDVTSGVITNSMTPGSVIKGASMLVGYNEGAIKVGEKIQDECIKIYSFPKKCSWKRLGFIDDLKALSYSSNVFQFKTAFKVANFKYFYNAKIGDVSDAFAKYRHFFNDIGLGSKTNIDLPIDGVGNIGTSNSPDLYLNYVIGQYDTYTTMQLSEYVSTIANYGARVNPHLLKEIRNSDNQDEIGSIYYKYETIETALDIDKRYVDRVREGFKRVMIDGLGKDFMGKVNNPAGKTGTSESFVDSDGDGKIDSPTLSNAFVGYYPSDNPKMSIAITFPNLVDINGSNSSRSYANKRVTKRISNKFFEIYG